MGSIDNYFYEWMVKEVIVRKKTVGHKSITTAEIYKEYIKDGKEDSFFKNALDEYLNVHASTLGIIKEKTIGQCNSLWQIV